MFILFFLVLVAGFVIAVLFWPYVYAYLIDPVTRIFWLVIRMFLVVDQEVYWFLIIFTGFILVAFMIPSRQEKFRHAYDGSQVAPENRIAYWKALLESAEDDSEAEQILQQYLEELQKNVYSLAGSGETSTCNQTPLKTTRNSGRLAQIPYSLRFRFLQKKDKSINSSLMKRVHQMVAEMETTLEIENDHSIEPNHHSRG